MMAVDKTAPTEEEHRLKAVTKPRSVKVEVRVTDRIHKQTRAES